MQVAALALFKVAGQKGEPRRALQIPPAFEAERKMDSLYMECFLAKADTQNEAFSAEISTDNGAINEFFRLCFNAEPKNVQRIDVSTVFTALNLLMPIGKDIDKLRHATLELFMCQFKSGAVMDYVCGGGYFMSGDVISAAALPLVAASFVNYTGDRSFFKERTLYARQDIGNSPIKSRLGTDSGDSVYNHCIAALNYCKNSLNGHMLICAEAGGVLSDFEAISGIEDIAATLFYCFSAQSFMPFIEEDGERVKLIFLVEELRKSIVKKLFSIGGLNGITSMQELLHALIYITCHSAGDKRQALLGEIEDAVKAMQLPEGFFDCALPGIITAGVLLAERRQQAARLLCGQLIKKYSAKSRYGGLISTLILRSLGLDFKNGFLRLKDKSALFTVKFPYGGHNITLSCQSKKSGTTVNGLPINNLDYINLKGYNKDMIIVAESVAGA